MVDASDPVWIDVLPSMSKFGPALGSGAGAAATKQGVGVGKKFGKSMLLGVGAVAGGAAIAGKALYSIGETFDEVSDTIRVGTGATGKSLDGLVASAKSVGTKVPASFDDIGTTVADVNTRLGLTGPTLEKFSSQALEAGRIMGEEIDINALSGAFSSFKIEGKDTTAAMDHLFRVSQATGVGMNELAQNVSKNAPAMQALGFSFEETAGLAGTLDKAGLDSTKTMTGMGKALVELAKEGEEPQEAFKRVTGEMQGFLDKGDKAAALDLASDLFGTRNASAFIGALDSGKVSLDDLANVAGMTDDTILGAGKATQDFGEKWQMVKNRALLAVAPVAERVFSAMGDGADLLLDKAIPAFDRFVAQWDKGVGAGGRFRTTVFRIGGVIKSVGGFLIEHRRTIGLLVTAYAAFKVINATMRAYRAVMLAVRGAQLGYAAATYGAVGASMAQTRAEKLGLVVGRAKLIVTRAITVAQKGAAVATRLLNAAMRANPIGALITVVTLLVGALVLLYKKNDTARRIMNQAWRNIKDVVSGVVNWFTKTAWPAMKKAFQNLSDVAKALWQKGIKPAFKGIGGVISWWYKNVVKRYFGLVKAVFQGAAASAKWLWKGGIKPAFSGIAAVVKWMWARIKANFALLRAGMGLVSAGAKRLYDKGIRPAFNSISSKASWLWGKAKWAFGRMQNGMGKVSAAAKTLYDKGIRPAFNSISNKAAWLWGKVKWAFDKIKAGAGAVKTAMGTAKDGIKKSWAKVYGAIKDPIVKALKWVQNTFVKKMRGFLGKIPGVSASLIPNISLKGFARGGWTGPGSKYQPAGVVHADEYVVNKKSRGRFERRNPGVLDHINRTGDMPGYAIGGKVAGLNLRFKKMLDQFNAAAGNRYSVNSGYRSNAHQQVLYNRYLAGRGPVAARPGSSQHNKGLAADLAPSNARDVHQGLARSMGLVFTVPSESWHIEPSWGRGSNAGPSSTGGGGGIGLPGWATNPLNWVKGKFKSIMGGFDKGKYGLAGEILPPVLGKLKGAVTKQLKSAAASLNPLSGGKASNFSFGKFKAGTNQVVGKQLAAQAGFTGGQWTALRKLWQKESNWNHKAMNGSSGAYGIPQSLPGSKMRSAGADWRTNPATQIKWGLDYIKGRYRNPAAAWAHSQRTNWYADGGRVQPAVFDNGGTLAPGLNLVNNKLGKPEPLVRADQSRSVHITSGALKLDPKGRVFIEGIAEEVVNNRDSNANMRTSMGVRGG